jgi:hypothetical protein
MGRPKLNTPESNELSKLKKERRTRVGNVVKGVVAGGIAGTAAGYLAGKAGQNVFKGTTTSKRQGRQTSTGMGGYLGAGLGAAVGATKTTPNNPLRTPEQAKSDRTRIRTLRPIVRAQRKTARGK